MARVESAGRALSRHGPGSQSQAQPVSCCRAVGCLLSFTTLLACRLMWESRAAKATTPIPTPKAAGDKPPPVASSPVCTGKGAHLSMPSSVLRTPGAGLLRNDIRSRSSSVAVRARPRPSPTPSVKTSASAPPRQDDKTNKNDAHALTPNPRRDSHLREMARRAVRTRPITPELMRSSSAVSVVQEVDEGCQSLAVNGAPVNGRGPPSIDSGLSSSQDGAVVASANTNTSPQLNHPSPPTTIADLLSGNAIPPIRVTSSRGSLSSQASNRLRDGKHSSTSSHASFTTNASSASNLSALSHELDSRAIMAEAREQTHVRGQRSGKALTSSIRRRSVSNMRRASTVKVRLEEIQAGTFV